MNQEIPDHHPLEEGTQAGRFSGVVSLSLIFVGMILGGYLLFTLFGTRIVRTKSPAGELWKEYRRNSDSLLRAADVRIEAHLGSRDSNRLSREILEALQQQDSLTAAFRVRLTMQPTNEISTGPQ